VPAILAFYYYKLGYEKTIVGPIVSVLFGGNENVNVNISPTGAITLCTICPVAEI
jgi:hypothetical protein